MVVYLAWINCQIKLYPSFNTDVSVILKLKYLKAEIFKSIKSWLCSEYKSFYVLYIYEHVLNVSQYTCLEVAALHLYV